MKHVVKLQLFLLCLGGFTPSIVYSQPLESQSSAQRPANGQGQVPSFAGQARAAALAPMPSVQIAYLNENLPHGWGLALLPDATFLMIVKRGGMLLLDSSGKILAGIDGVPDMDARGQGGLLDVVLSPDFAQSRKIYFSYSEPRGGGRNATSVALATLPPTGQKRTLQNLQVIFRQNPAQSSNLHFGSRLVFDQEGHLYVTLGERSHLQPRLLAQDLSTTLGKVVRIGADGSFLADNPFSMRQDAGRDIWSYGHRNIQAATLDAQGRLWTVEHGPRGGDELNRPEAGKNYGWPVITYGLDYSGAPIGDGLTVKEGMEQPVYYWDPVIAPSGMAFYDGEMFLEWKNSFLIGGLQARAIVVVKMADDRVAAEGHIPLQARVRDVRTHLDGSIFALLEREGGSVLVHLTRGK